MQSLRRQLVLCGFFGRGNAGDEALLQCIYAYFSPRYEIVLCVDEHGAYPGFWDWFPYIKCRLIHQGNLSFLLESERTAGVLVGGGGLPAGFALQQVFGAAARDIPCALVGTDGLVRLKANGSYSAMSLASLRMLYSYIAPRSRIETERLIGAGIPAIYGADWALQLPTDANGISTDPKRVVITLRELPQDRVSPSDIERVRKLISDLESADATPHWLPCCPEDERFLQEQNLSDLCEIQRCWWNPRAVKGWIEQSGLCISIGRLHPLIFAASARTPVAALAIQPWTNTHAEEGRLDKIDTMCQELDICRFESEEQLMDAFVSGRIVPSAEEKLIEANKRLSRVQNDLDVLFG